MKFSKVSRNVFALFSILLLAACGGSSSSSTGNSQSQKNLKRVDWGSVESTWNPSVDIFAFHTDGSNRLALNVFGFEDDVEIIYSADVPANTGFLKIHKVMKNSARWGSLNDRQVGSTLEINSYGTYQCSIQIRNGRITDLDGGCYVSIEIHLPLGSEIEVYNAKKLISKRFIPMDVKTFLKNIDDATWPKDQFLVIEEFLNSYTQVSKVPTLNALEIGKVIHEFTWKDDKFKALRMLHSYVSDRENLRKMVENEFSYFEREEAFRICGV